MAEGFFTCPLCGEPERPEDVIGGVCLACSDAVTFSHNARRAGVLVSSEIDRAPQGVIRDQPPPRHSEGAPVWDLVIADMQERDRIGRERYGTPLQTHNGRDALVDAYQEALDLVVYLRQAIAERDE